MELTKLEEERLTALQSYKKKIEIGYILLFVGLLSVVIFSIVIAKDERLELVFIVLLVLSILMILLSGVFIFLAVSENRKYQSRVSHLVAKFVLESLYGKIECDDKNSTSIDELIAFDVAEKPDRLKAPNHYFGKYQNIIFETSSLILEKEMIVEKAKKTKKIYKTYFDGFFIHLKFKNPHKGTLIIKESEFWSTSKDPKLEKFETGDSIFDLKFKIYTSNQKLAEYILKPHFIKHLSEIADANSSQTSLLISGDDLYLVLDEHNKYQKFGLKTSLNLETLEKTIANYQKIKILSDDLLEKDLITKKDLK